MFGSTMMLTVGQALDRAQQEAYPVRIQVAGEWLTGTVQNTDTQSVLLAGEDGTTFVLSIDAITVVAVPPEVGPDGRTHVPMQPSQARI
jgi:hypothetical protein